MKEKYYLIKSFKTNKIYYVNYLKNEENEIIFFSGVRHKCVIVTINTDNLTREYNNGKYGGLPTKQHIILIMHGYSPDKNLYSIHQTPLNRI
jgi:hypothetical protein